MLTAHLISDTGLHIPVTLKLQSVIFIVYLATGTGMPLNNSA